MIVNHVSPTDGLSFTARWFCLLAFSINEWCFALVNWLWLAKYTSTHSRCLYFHVHMFHFTGEVSQLIQHKTPEGLQVSSLCIEILHPLVIAMRSFSYPDLAEHRGEHSASLLNMTYVPSLIFQFLLQLGWGWALPDASICPASHFVP